MDQATESSYFNQRQSSTSGNLSYYRTGGGFITNSSTQLVSSIPESPSQSISASISNNAASIENSTKYSKPADLKLINTEIDSKTCPYGCCKTEGVSEYIFLKGLIQGAYYDVIIKAFGKSYKLHRLFLDKSDYFKSLFTWSESANVHAAECDDDNDDIGSDDTDNTEHSKFNYRKVYEIDFEDDSRYTQLSFELAIARLYGAVNIKEENKVPYNMIAIGQYLAVRDVVCTATDFIVKNMEMSNIAENLRFAIMNNYGSASERIIQNGKGILCSDGWECGPEAWDGIPTLTISEVIGEDYFFVPTEWERCIFIIKLIERRQEMNDRDEEIESIEPLKLVLNKNIHYCHMSPDQLQELESLYDINEEHYIDPQVLHTSLWQAVQLETLVTKSVDSPHLDQMITSPVPPTLDQKWFKVPSKDETLSGLPAELDSLLTESLCTTVTNKVGQEDGKSTQDHHSYSKNEKLYNWTKIPPFRFSVAFANVSDLSTDRRVYGKTFWYAGSYWNLYLQKSHIPYKNNYQVGVYLHRAHSGSSNPSSKNGLINPDIFINNVNYHSLPKKYVENDRIHSPQSIPRSRSEIGNPLKKNASDHTLSNFIDLSISDDHYMRERYCTTTSRTSSKKLEDRTVLNYEDHRNAIKVYFVIFTPSRRAKPTITSFLSVPNDFSKSQSWGWKSNNMCVFKEDGTFPENHDAHLKFMILLGNV